MQKCRIYTHYLKMHKNMLHVMKMVCTKYRSIDQQNRSLQKKTTKSILIFLNHHQISSFKPLARFVLFFSTITGTERKETRWMTTLSCFQTLRLSPDAVRWTLLHSGCRVLFLERSLQLPLLTLRQNAIAR